MAKVVLNPGLQQIRGRVAGFVYRMRYGKQTISKVPDMSGVNWSPAQIEHRQRFKRAVAYARTAMADQRCAPCMRRKARRRANGPSTWRYLIISRVEIC